MQGPLGHRLRLLRAERGLTLREVKELTGLDQWTITKIEHGKAHPRGITLGKLAKAYRVPLEDLLEPVPA